MYAEEKGYDPYPEPSREKAGIMLTKMMEDLAVKSEVVLKRANDVLAGLIDQNGFAAIDELAKAEEMWPAYFATHRRLCNTISENLTSIHDLLDRVEL